MVRTNINAGELKNRIYNWITEEEDRRSFELVDETNTIIDTLYNVVDLINRMTYGEV